MVPNFGKRIFLSAACVLLLGMMTPLTSFAHSISIFRPSVQVSHKDLLQFVNVSEGTVNVVSAYKCLGGVGTGAIEVTVTQQPANSGLPAGTVTGTTVQIGGLNCDGKSHKIAVPVFPTTLPGFNLGTATAMVILFQNNGTTVSDREKIKIVGV